MKSNGNIQIFNIDTRKQNDPLIEKIQMVKRMRIWNVADENVCTLICLEATNAWLYDASEMDCLCLGLKLVASTKKLIQKLDPADLPSDSQDSLFFVKMDNLLSGNIGQLTTLLIYYISFDIFRWENLDFQWQPHNK